MRPMIYVAGPISKGDMSTNIRTALETARKLWDMGYVPFVPQLSFFWHTIFPQDAEERVHVKRDGSLNFWMAYDFEIIRRCEVLFRLPGQSTGADMEELKCLEWDIPIVRSLDEAKEWIAKQ